jgi:hypothetical protein
MVRVTPGELQVAIAIQGERAAWVASSIGDLQAPVGKVTGGVAGRRGRAAAAASTTASARHAASPKSEPRIARGRGDWTV